MPVYEITSPEGVKLRIEGDTPPTESDLNNIFSSYRPKKEPGFFESVGNMFTGADRETRATQELPEFETGLLTGDQNARGFASTSKLSGPEMAAKVTAIATTDDPQERANIIKTLGPEFGIQYDEKGNVIAANNKTGQRILLNKPGLSAADISPAFGRTAASLPAFVTGVGPTAVATAAGIEGGITAGQEALQASQGGDFDISNVIFDTVTGGFGQALPDVLARFKAANKAKSERLASDADRLADEAVQAEAARIENPLSQESIGVEGLNNQNRMMAQQAQSAAEQKAGLEEISQNIIKQGEKRKPNLKKAAGDVDADLNVIEAAERLGVAEDLTPGMVSKNPIYKDIEGALRAKGGNELSVQGENAIQKVAQTADDLIKDFGGEVDKAAFSDQVRDSVGKTIKDLDAIGSEAYSKVNSLVPPTSKVDMEDVFLELQQQADDLGGNQFLEPFEKRLLKLSEENPSYALIDKERKKIGAALQKKQGAYKDMDTGRLKRMYGLLTDAQGKNLSDEALAAWNAAKAVTKKRKDLEDKSITLFGKQLNDSLAPKLGGAIKRLSNADTKKFDDLLAAIPDQEMRQKAVLTALNDAFTTGSRKEKQLSIPGFVDWYSSLKSQPKIMNRIRKNLPNGAAKRLEDIYTVAKSIRDANARSIKTGIAAETLKGMDEYQGILERVYRATGGVPVVENATALLKAVGLAGKDKATVAADKLISSPEFKRMAVELAKSNNNSSMALKAAEDALKRSQSYRQWFRLLPSDDKAKIISKGLSSYFVGAYGESKDNTE